MAERTPFRWEMVDGGDPVPMPATHEEALEMALTLALVCQDFGADDFIEMAEELAEDGMDEEIVGNIKIKAEANEALEAATGQDFAFDPLAPDRQAEAIARWRAWLIANPSR